MRHFTNTERINGELAARSLSPKATRFYDGEEIITIFEYSDYIENEAGDLEEVTRYAYTLDRTRTDRRGIVANLHGDGLTFEELDKELAEMCDY